MMNIDEREEVTRAVGDFFAEAKTRGHRPDALVREFISITGCARASVYYWINGTKTVSKVYNPIVRRALRRLREKYEII